ncbi:MAG: phosphoribosylamine--glycine ligase, partial [Thermoplasmata archaeon]|nr:phosphoribosylamine--glycine ligase [Thermoplasmata archaeon]
MRVLVVGGGAREHAIAHALSAAEAEIAVAAPLNNPGLARVARAYARVDPTQTEPVVRFAREQRVDYAVIGPEAPLAAGLGDALRTAEIPVVGPSKDGARIESSKRYCRELLEKYGIPGSPRVLAVQHLDEVDARIAEFHEAFVVKPVGLTSGKGVAVQGADFQTPAEGASYAKQLLASSAGRDGILLEEKVEGEEFSLMAFVTDSGIYPMPTVQDYKRVGEGDTGPNTGGMGSYSQRDHLLPFLSSSARDRALDILTKTVDALRAEGITYRGILYGGFMQTSRGPVLLEFNARFGDPESINVLSLYETQNFVEVLYGVATGRVKPTFLQFRLRASVVRYIVPPGYPGAPRAGGILEIDEPAINDLGVQVRYGAVEPAGAGRVTMASSRAIALVGEASAIHAAATRVEAALAYVRGDYLVRHDIGTQADVTARVEHLRRLFVPGAKPSPLPLSVA